jgi:uncharacterized phage protein (TIGR01671 family)
MNREIKFEYGFQSTNGIVKKTYFLHEIPNIKELCDVWNELPIAYVREYTGLKDRNEKEIYEGDIIEEGMVFWSDEYLGFFVKGNFVEGDNKPLYDISLLKIISNIYENPELP